MIGNKLLNKGERGFTLVETIATIFVFSVMAVIISGIWTRAVQIERKGFSSQVIQENALAVLDLMAKEIRVSTVINQDNNCSSSLSGTLTMTFNDPDGGSGQLIYRLNSEGVVERVYGGTTYEISSTDIRFNSLGFCIIGSSTSPYGNDATRVTIVASISNRIGRDIITVNTQTSVTLRDFTGEIQN